jgi:superfamily II DNA or RNA helicase
MTASWRRTRSSALDLDRDLQGGGRRRGWSTTSARRSRTASTTSGHGRVLVLNERTKRVAEANRRVHAGTDPYGKTIVFCEDIDHAVRMRSALVNEVALRMPEEAATVRSSSSASPGDNGRGQGALYDFTHPEKRYPVIATTSKLLTTGVDAKTCKLIVLDQRIQSMIEFKQIVGRGTRIHEETGKTLVHRDGLQEGHRALRRSRLRRRSGGHLRADGSSRLQPPDAEPPITTGPMGRAPGAIGPAPGGGRSTSSAA